MKKNNLIKFAPKPKEKPIINLGDLYHFNKQAMAQLDPLDSALLNVKIKEVSDRMATKEYWMLLCNERKDYSVFKINNKDNIQKELKETLYNRGLILAIDKQKDENYEIWIRDSKTKENFVYYLFDYTFGIIET